MDGIEIPIEDVLDLHTFRPKDVPDVLESYLGECVKEGIYSVRIIHGKGQGILRERVYGVLKKNPLVTAISAAPGHAGGWGATLVELKRRS